MKKKHAKSPPTLDDKMDDRTMQELKPARLSPKNSRRSLKQIISFWKPKYFVSIMERYVQCSITTDSDTLKKFAGELFAKEMIDTCMSNKIEVIRIDGYEGADKLQNMLMLQLT